MKLIYVKVKGVTIFKNEELILDFRIKKRVRNDIVIDELDEIQENFYLANTIPFIGINSSGKTTTLSWLFYLNSLMFLGSKVDIIFLSPQNELEIEYNYLVNYNDKYKIIKNTTLLEKSESGGTIVKEEKIYEKELRKKDRNNTVLDFEEKHIKYDSTKFENSSEIYLYNKQYLQNKNIDIVTYYQYTNEDKLDFNNNAFVTYFKNKLNENTIKRFEGILKLLDNEIEYIKMKELQNLEIKYRGKSSYVTTLENLSTLLSSGTKRGAMLFYTAYLILKKGGILIIDEIELHLHKALIIELIALFQSKKINEKKATLIFTTHYVEIIDLFVRNDNIHILRNDCGISNYLLSDKINRNDNKKSKIYLNEIIDSSPSYDQKMEVRKLFYE